MLRPCSSQCTLRRAILSGIACPAVRS
jgi:hypothetical protein